jgi:HEAT repeat protein
MTRTTNLALVFCLLLCGTAAAQQARFDDVVRNLRNPDPKVRLSAVRLLRESKYPEAAAPVAALVTDPVDQIQLEAIAAELSFFLVDDVPARKRVGLVVEVRRAGQAAAAFDVGPMSVWPHPVPPELVRALLQAVDDENQKVRIEAIYAFGTIVRAPFPDDVTPVLIKALDHYDPAVRAAAARVTARLQVRSAGDALIKAMNDSSSDVRYAAMRALGALRDERAVQALTEQLSFYAKGEGAWAAMDALAHIGHASSVPLFKARIADKDPFLRRAAAEGLARSGDTSEIPALQIGAGNDTDDMARASMAFALQKLGRNYLGRLVEFMNSPKRAAQIAGYFIELGPSITPELVPFLKDPSSGIRANLAQVMGELGGPASVAALQPLTQDPDPQVAQSATRALERLKIVQPRP